jgi:asparagine synthase (glutamine-hydrolysing)
VWIDGSVGLGHALLATTEESIAENQPCTLDGRVWITADARIDGRSELIGKLHCSHFDAPETFDDAELILAAYDKWGEACLDHLLGDFAFAIWDSRKQRLFCARDHLGVKPFYYARIGDLFLFSNTLDCLRCHPAVSDELNDLAIADFLLFGINHDLAATSFADIRRLPAAHTLVCSGEGPAVSRYWTMPVEGPLRYKRKRDYVDRFLELLERAVRDRLRTDRVTVLMSGGMDSTSVAAIARKVGRPSLDLRAFTVTYDPLIPDKERHFAALAAETLKTPIEFLPAGDHQLYEGCTTRGAWTCEPRDFSERAFQIEQYAAIQKHSRVVLTGEGGDPALLPTDLEHLLRGSSWWRVTGDLLGYVWTHRRRPPLGLRNTWARWTRKQDDHYPEWLNPEFERRLKLRARWEDLRQPSPPVHRLRPRAYSSFTSSRNEAWWSCLFENYDAGYTGNFVEVRHPILDLRLVRFLLAVPPLPWCADKDLLRVAMRGLLPDEIRLRPKTPMAGDPTLERLRHRGMAWIDHFDPVPALASYVDRGAVPGVTGPQARQSWHIHVGPFELNLWLKHFQWPSCLSEKVICYES